MGRRRKPNKVPLTSIAISIDTLEMMSKLKIRRETNDELVKRIVSNWLDLRDDKVNLEHLISWKDRIIVDKDKKIADLEMLLKKQQKKKYLNPVNFFFQSLNQVFNLYFIFINL